MIDGVNMIPQGSGQIYGLIGKAMAEVGAIGKNSRNEQQGFMYRGIDAVYNTLYPVMAKYGLFIAPEILEHKREERTTTKTWNNQTKTTTLLYSIITVRYTVYAPDGSNIQMTVIGEGMDSGDKATNKAMSVAMKYAMFQLFMIPTEAVDPDSECHEVDPKVTMDVPAPMRIPPVSARVTTAAAIPQAKAEAAETAQKQPETAGQYMMRRIGEMKKEYAGLGFDFPGVRKTLIDGGIVPDVPSATMTMEQAEQLMREVEFFYEEKKAAS